MPYQSLKGLGKPWTFYNVIFTTSLLVSLRKQKLCLLSSLWRVGSKRLSITMISGNHGEFWKGTPRVTRAHLYWRDLDICLSSNSLTYHFKTSSKGLLWGGGETELHTDTKMQFWICRKRLENVPKSFNRWCCQKNRHKVLHRCFLSSVFGLTVI